MRRNISVTLINILGLALGMAVAATIGLLIRQELSFDKNFANYRHISQLMLTGTFSGEVSTDASVSPPMAEALRTQFASDFEKVALTTKTEKHIFSYHDTKLSSPGIFAQSDFPSLFSLIQVEGSVKNITDPASVLVSRSLAGSLFGKEAAAGKTIRLDNKDNFKIAGVYEDFPLNSSLRGVQFISSWEYYATINSVPEDRWNECRFAIYTQLKNGIDNDAVSNKIAALAKEHCPDINPVLLLHPMSKWHLYETFQNGKNVGGRIQYVWMFGLIGLFVLLLACINFMNLATARSQKCSKEVGIMKVAGSGRKQIVYRFLVESLLTVIAAFCISMLLVWLCSPALNSLSNTDIKIPVSNGWFWLICVAFVFFTAIVAGSFPAFYLSSFDPVKVLKGSNKTGKGVIVPRKVLVVIQFFTSIFLIIATMVVLQQLRYSKNRPIGYNVKGVVNIPVHNIPEKDHAVLKQQLLQSGAARKVAFSSSPVNRLSLSMGGYSWEGIQSKEEAVFGTMSVDEDFAQTVQWKFKEGRNFSAEFLSDSAAVIINETAARYMQLKAPVNHTLYSQRQPYRIIGVIHDAIMGSPFTSVNPTVFFLGTLPLKQITIALPPNVSPQDALKKIKTVFSEINPETLFEYEFVDEQYAKQFRSVEETGKLAAVFTVLAVFISCLGLYALSSFIAEQRIKEIGIRKVLGASVWGLLQLLSKEFIYLVIIAFAIAMPLAYWSMNSWLENYYYHTSIAWHIFVFAAVVIVCIAFFTISFQTVKAARANPVKSLRSE